MTGRLETADCLLVDNRGKILSVTEAAFVLDGKSAHGVIGSPCWKLMGLRRRDGTPFCGPDCPVRSRPDRDGALKIAGLVWERGEGKREALDLLTFSLPGTNGVDELIMHLIVPLASAPSDCSRITGPDCGREALSTLTNREHEVLEYLADGDDTETIADRLFISPITVKHHVQNIMSKLGVHRRIDAILIWMGQSTVYSRRARQQLASAGSARG